MNDFKKFKNAVEQQFQRMSVLGRLFRVKASKDEMWNLYLSSFPEGTNKLYRTRREYDCSCCRHFIHTMGNVVGVGEDNALISIWDITCDDPTYQTVADRMSSLIHMRLIDNAFLHTERFVGADKTYEHAFGEKVTTWNHFAVGLHSDVVLLGPDIGPQLSQERASHDVLIRGLEKTKIDALDTVLDLISQGSLYRGDEHKDNVERFKHLKQQFDAQSTYGRQDALVWNNLQRIPVARFTNTAIGTLVLDLSEGTEVEPAVRRYEKMVAPENYKRPTALVTRAMIESAKATIQELGLGGALNRRYAHLNDISASDILFADRSIVKSLRGHDVLGVLDSLPVKTSSHGFKEVEKVTMDDFLINILPRCESVELYVENKHATRFVSLITAEDPTAPHLFKWDNPFSWSYIGDYADSIKERVKKAGGSVTGDLCCRLSWSNTDDLDLHMTEPGGYEIYFANKTQPSPSGGVLDVDMNACLPLTSSPVENIVYADKRRMKEGVYTLFVRQFRQREQTNFGFTVEFDWLGEVFTYHYANLLRDSNNVFVARFGYTRENGVKLFDTLPSEQLSRRVWGLDTQMFHRVNLICQSPNFWHSSIGNQHYLFMLEGCRNEGSARGIYNEFLRDDLTKHRKVIEMVGAKMRTEEDQEQLSGLGFSYSQDAEVVVKVKGALSRTLRIVL
jgi:hypothetical protein